MNEPLFPTIQKSLESLIEDEEGNIPAGKLLTIGTLIVLLSSVLITVQLVIPAHLPLRPPGVSAESKAQS